VPFSSTNIGKSPRWGGETFNEGVCALKDPKLFRFVIFVLKWYMEFVRRWIVLKLNSDGAVKRWILELTPLENILFIFLLSIFNSVKFTKAGGRLSKFVTVC